MATRTRVRRCSVCGRKGHDKRAHRNVKGRRINPDWFRDAFGRPHPIRSSPNYDEGAVGRARSYRREVASSYGTGPRGGYTWEEPKGDRARRATRAGVLRKSGGGRGPSGAQVTGRLEALARGKTRAQKQNEKARRVASRGF